MKTLIAISLTALFSVSAMLDIEVPDAVANAFKSKFPDAKKVAWEMEDDMYEAEFKHAGEKKEACFKADGTWVYTAKEMKKNDLPDELTEALTKVYPSYKIMEVEAVEHALFGECYGIELKNNKGRVLDMFLSKTGEVLEQKAEEPTQKDN